MHKSVEEKSQDTQTHTHMCLFVSACVSVYIFFNDTNVYVADENIYTF